MSLNTFQASVSLFMKGWYGLNNFKFDGDLELHLVVSVNSPHCLFNAAHMHSSSKAATLQTLL